MNFRQYLMPDGRTKDISIDRPEEIEEMAGLVVHRGGRFEIEMLSVNRDGGDEISVTCVHEDMDIAIELCLNGPEVPEAVDKVVRAAYEATA